MSCFEHFSSYTAVFKHSDSELMDVLSRSEENLKGRL